MNIDCAHAVGEGPTTTTARMTRVRMRCHLHTPSNCPALEATLKYEADEDRHSFLVFFLEQTEIASFTGDMYGSSFYV